MAALLLGCQHENLWYRNEGAVPTAFVFPYFRAKLKDTNVVFISEILLTVPERSFCGVGIIVNYSIISTGCLLYDISNIRWICITVGGVNILAGVEHITSR